VGGEQEGGLVSRDFDCWWWWGRCDLRLGLGRSVVDGRGYPDQG